MNICLPEDEASSISAPFTMYILSCGITRSSDFRRIFMKVRRAIAQKKQLAFILLFIVIGAGQLRADMASFKERIEDAEQTPAKEEDTSSDKDEDENNPFSEVIYTLLGHIWFYNNVYIHYGAYPYSDGKYIRRPAIALSAESETGTKPVYPVNAKYYWLSASLSGFYLNEIGGGAWLSFSGNVYKFIGPYADVYLATDGNSLLNGTRLGAHLSLIQSNPFNMSFYAQWNLWNGALTRNGASFGLELRLYPVKPLTFRFKLGGQNFEGFSLGEVEAEMGIMLKAWECFIGYRAWTLEDESWAGPYLGVRHYF
jgi:hypothetical protein